jgi:hypothetical protein
MTGRFPMVDKRRLAEARLVADYAPALDDEVLAGQNGARSGAGTKPCFNTVRQYLAELRKLEEAGPDH